MTPEEEFPKSLLRWLRGFHLHREKPKVTDWLTVTLTLGVAFAAGYSAYLFQGQLTEMRRQTRQNLETSRMDERAWIEIEPIALPANPGAQLGAFRYELYPKNVGKTSATDIQINVLRGSSLTSITMGDNADMVARAQDMLINGAIKDVPRANPISKVLGANTVAPVPFVMDGQAPQIFSKDEWVSYLIGRIDYRDAFNVPHWLKFCFFVVDSKGNLWNCKEGNDEDRNPELPAN